MSTEDIFAVDKDSLYDATSIAKNISVADAKLHPLWDLIEQEMNNEIQGKMARGRESWRVVLKPPGAHVMKSRWVISIIYNADGSVKKVKCRFVGCGYSQIAGFEYDEVFAGTLRNPCFRNFCAMAAGEDLEMDEFDAIKAFTQACVDKLLYVEMPEGFAIPGYVLELLRALEGIKQGANLFMKLNSSTWTDKDKCGLTQSDIEPNIYRHPTARILIASFADNNLGAYKKCFEALYLQMKQVYNHYIKVDYVGLHPVSQFLGVSITRDRILKTLTLCQAGYIKRVSDNRKGKFELRDSPIPNTKLARDNFMKMTTATCDADKCDRSEYLGVMGEMGWVIGMTMGEYCGLFSFLGTFMQNPSKTNLAAAYHVYGNIVQMKDYGITYGGELRTPMGLTSMPDNFLASHGLHYYHDSSWGKPRPLGGHCMLYYGGATNWLGTGLKTETDSTAEAETAVASRASKDARFHKLLHEDMGCPSPGPVTAITDNKALHDLVNKPGASARTRYFERATRFVKYAQKMLYIKLFLISTHFMVADIFTKPLEPSLFYRFRNYMKNTRNTRHGSTTGESLRQSNTRITSAMHKLQAFVAEHARLSRFV